MRRNKKEKIMSETSFCFSPEAIASLRERVRPYLTEKRYLHTLAVEEEAATLGSIFGFDGTWELRAAALLHDITKAQTLEKQLQYCKKFDIIVGSEDILSPKTFHAKTASRLITLDFPSFASENVIGGIRWHTTGRRGMTLFESIIYLADYIEKTRTFEDCIRLREHFYSSLEKGDKSPLEVLIDTMVLSFDMTVNCLIGEGALIDGDTVAARNYFIEVMKGKEKFL